MEEKFNRPWQAAWDKRHLKTFATKLTLKQAHRVRTECDRIGITPYRLVQNLLLQWLQDRETGKRPPDRQTIYFY